MKQIELRYLKQTPVRMSLADRSAVVVFKVDDFNVHRGGYVGFLQALL